MQKTRFFCPQSLLYKVDRLIVGFHRKVKGFFDKKSSKILPPIVDFYSSKKTAPKKFSSILGAEKNTQNPL